jgi:protein tyrosine/serine phosphatase
MNMTSSTFGVLRKSLFSLVALVAVVPCNVMGQQAIDGLTAALPNDHKTSAPTNETKPKLAPENCKIKNFGKVTDQYFRGAQPKPEEYTQLADLGVKTVIDLRDDAEGFAKTKASAAGLNYLNLPMSDTVYPKQETIQRFLELVKDQSNFPIYVHCRGGRHRTGVVTAVYRMTFDGWDIDKTYNEMKDYDFYTRWGHKQMKTFVFDFWKTLQAKRQEEAVVKPSETVVPE